MNGPGTGPARDIVLVANSVNELGGVTNWSHQMARLFTERGHRVRVVGIEPARVPRELGADLPYPVTTLYSEHPPRAWRPSRFRDRFNWAERWRQAGRRAGMRDRAAVLSEICHNAGPGGIVIVTQVWAMEWVELADTAGMRVIGMTHESIEESKRTTRFARVLRHFGEVDRLLALTREDADQWILQGLDNVGFMPNPLPWTPRTTSPRSSRVVASIGRFDDQKRIDLLLEAWELAAPRHPGWTLRVYGAGGNERELKEQCTAAGLDGSVEWMGATADVPGALRAASVFALSSRGEGFPLVLLEAMACAVPCVAFDCAPGVREIIADGVDGLLAPPGNVRELADRLGRMMGDKELRDTMGERARRSVARYSSEEIVRRWEELFAFLER